MQYETWYETDLTKYRLTFGDKSLITLLATTGNLYVTAVKKKLVEGEEIHWVFYLSRLYMVENPNVPSRDYEEKVGKMLEELGKDYGKEKVGKTFHFLWYGEVDEDSVGEVEFDEEGRVKTFPEQNMPWRMWTNIYPRRTYVKEEDYVYLESLRRLHPWKIKFFLPPAIDLPAKVEGDEKLEKYLEAHPTHVAAIYHTPRKLSCNDRGGHIYSPIHCVAGRDVGEVKRYLEAHPREYVTPISLYMYSSINAMKCIDTFLDVDEVSGELFPNHYTSMTLEAYRRDMRKEYKEALRYGHAEEMKVIHEEEKEQE